MIGLLMLAFVGISLFVVFVGVVAAMSLIRGILWLVLLPIRLLLGILFLPFLILKLVIGTAVFALLLPVVIIGSVLALLAGVMAIAVPLFPLLCIAFVVWVVMRAARPVVV
jgi:hypothetical protein